MKNTKNTAANDKDLAYAHASAYYEAVRDPKRYHERTCRNQFWFRGEIGQRKIQNLKVAIAGLGGMGSNIAESLVRVGVGHIRIADPDHIDLSNLNRQVIANQKSLGVSKTKASAAELRSIAEDFELVTYEQGVEQDMVDEFVKGCDAIVDEIDVFPLDRHVMLHRAATKYNIPLYSAYVVGLGIHFYKFQGSDYTFEKFLNVPAEQWKKPTADLLLDRFGAPMPGYLDESAEAGYVKEISSGGVPIFGPSTLMGHSLVTTRLILDQMGTQTAFKTFPKTPTMPEFLVLDGVDFTFKKARVK